MRPKANTGRSITKGRWRGSPGPAEPVARARRPARERRTAEEPKRGRQHRAALPWSQEAPGLEKHKTKQNRKKTKTKFLTGTCLRKKRNPETTPKHNYVEILRENNMKLLYGGKKTKPINENVEVPA